MNYNRPQPIPKQLNRCYDVDKLKEIFSKIHSSKSKEKSGLLSPPQSSLTRQFSQNHLSVATAASKTQYGKTSCKSLNIIYRGQNESCNEQNNSTPKSGDKNNNQQDLESNLLTNINRKDLRQSTGFLEELRQSNYRPRQIIKKNNMLFPLSINKQPSITANRKDSDILNVKNDRKSDDTCSVNSKKSQKTAEKRFKLLIEKINNAKTKSLGKQENNKDIKVPAFIKSKYLEEIHQAENNKDFKIDQTNSYQNIYEQKIDSNNTILPAIIISVKPAIKKRTIDDFIIIRQLGNGSYGKAHLAIERKIGFICVLKVIKKDLVNQCEIQNLLREIKIQTYLEHKHITSMYGFFDDQQYLYLILELLPTGNLKHLASNKGLPEKVISNIILQICSATSYMHNYSILHRDIKPQNIFTYDNYIKMGDFGCAVYSDQARRSFIGSPCYLSPEQLRNQDYDEKIDIWEIGTLTYQLIFNKCPFEKDIFQMIHGQRHNSLSDLQFPLNPHATEQAKDFIRKALDKNSHSRMSSAEAYNHKFLKRCNEETQAKCIN